MRVKALAFPIDTAAISKAASASFLAVAIYFMLSSLALADCSGAGCTPMGDVLCTVVGFIYGNLGRGLATLAIIILGVGALLGKTSWGMAITVGIGISVIFGADDIANSLINRSGATC